MHTCKIEILMTVSDISKWDSGWIRTVLSGMKKMHIILLFIKIFLDNPSSDSRNAFLMKIHFINQSYGRWLHYKQRDVPPNRWDYSFLEFFRKAVENETDQEMKSKYLHGLRDLEATRDLWTESVKEINPLIQLCPGPNLELTEAKVELYKISVSFSLGASKLEVRLVRNFL